MILRARFVFALSLLFAMGVLIAYAGTSELTVRSATTTSTQATPTPTPVPATPAKLTVEDLKKLRWIEGTWRGTGVNQPAFFERYRWENDTTLAVDGFENEKLEKVTDTTRFELKDGEFGGGSDGARYVATALDDNSIRFGPVIKARNFFVWKRESKDLWTAIIQPLPRPDRPTKETFYKMERLPDPK
ncbi:MAG TPA: hypothetical protein VFX97_02810 [Pyrinomonadaceae bacterium]|nr:hypothetical protein [Pyrinomonadaceae bacterium]